MYRSRSAFSLFTRSQFKHEHCNEGVYQNRFSTFLAFLLVPGFCATAASCKDFSDQESKVKFYQNVYNAIAETLEDENHDDGSYGPIYVRLAWHTSGTFDKTTSTGGSNYCLIRQQPECAYGANNGLQKAMQRLEKIKEMFPAITYGDLYTLAGVVAIQEMEGPKISWRPGRVECPAHIKGTPDGRLPNAELGTDHIFAIFSRMGFTIPEMVALIGGGHSIGRCHQENSGYDGPWTYSPTTFSNQFFTLLLNEKWVDRKSVDPKWTGQKQYTNKASADQTDSLMMLPADFALITEGDRAYREASELFAKDDEKLRAAFASAFSKLLELGVPFPKDSSYILLESTADQERKIKKVL